jgi:tetratricopeptide (TPR) repeat protein/Ca2+-binding EF-hand superfamily protein
MRPTLTLAVLATLVAPATAQSAYELAYSPGRSIVRAADVDRSGDVTQEELMNFLDSLDRDEGGGFDRTRLMARLVTVYLDTDGDGLLLGSDVEARLTGLDKDGSGTLEPSEIQATIGGGGRPGRMVVDGVIAYGADTDEDGSVDADEWSVAVQLPEEQVSLDRVVAWIELAEKRGDGDANAFGASTLLLSLRAALDVTGSGSVKTEDIVQLTRPLDTNSDGTISADELSARRSANWGGGYDDVKGAGAPLIPWQRTLEDALALAEATGKPLLVCVNTDGETASDALARGRYSNPEFAELAAGFVPVLANPTRHTERDYDDIGRRIEDPRFGRLTGAEHIDIEPELYDRYFSGQRVAPRHIGVSPEGEILFDLYLLQNLRVIDRALEKHGRRDVLLPDVRGLDLSGLLASHDHAGRVRLEQGFLESDEPTRVWLARAALDQARSAQHPGLVRLALRDPSAAVRSEAVQSVVRHPERVDLDVIPEAVRLANREQRLALSKQLAAYAETLTETKQMRARRLGRMAHALTLESEVVDVDLWLAAVAGASAPTAEAPRDVERVYEALDRIGQRLRTDPKNPRLNALAAELGLRATEILLAQGAGNPGFVLMDARGAAERAVEADPDSTLGWASLAVCAHQLGDFEVAANAASRALPGLVDQAGSKLAADVLNALADSRLRALYEKLGTEEGWPAEWVPDVLGAYEVLVAHPRGTEAQMKAGDDAFWNLEAFARQQAFVRSALDRWPASATAHERLRYQILRDDGAAGLLVAYNEIDGPAGMGATVRWFEGLAQFVAAERLVQDKHTTAAIAAYGQSIATFQESMELEAAFASSALHYVALAWAGIARIHLEGQRLDDALEAMRAGASAYVGSFGTADGLGNTPAETARALRGALRRAQRDAAAEELIAYLSERGVEL